MMGSLYRFRQLTARFGVGGAAEGTDEVGIEAGGAPSGDRRFEQVVDRVVLSVGPMMASQVMPEVFHRVQFRGIRWKTQQRDVRRTDEFVRPVVSGTVPDQDGLDVRCQCLRQLSQKQFDDGGVEPWRDQSFGLARFSARRRQHIHETVLGLSYGSGT